MGALLLSWVLLAAPPTLGRCAPGAADTEAKGLWTSLREALERKDAPAVKQAWSAVEAHACFRFPLAETWRAPSPDDVEAMATWWERGGGEWLASGLSTSANPDFTVVPPDAPKRLDPKQDQGVARLLCPEGAPPSCAREAAGWALRAADALEPDEGHDAAEPRRKAEEACAAEAKKAKREEKYRAWRACLESHRPTGAQLPLGRFQAPKDGWWVLRGRRGHYHFCDEVRAYDLATGAAWVAKSCSGLVLQQGGTVDHDATDAARGVQVQVGRVPLDALREAAWVTMLAPHVEQHVQPYGWYVRRPPGLEPRLPDDGTMSGLGLGSTWVTSAQTQLAWSWQGGDGLRAAGDLTWPDSSNAAEDHADRLWRIAEAAFEEGCAPARPPSPLVVGGRPGVSGLDATPDSLRTAERRLLDALSGRAATGCPSAR